MKFLASLLTATALLSSCVSAIPLTEDHILALRADSGKDIDKGKKPQTTQTTDSTPSISATSENKKEYPIEGALEEWMTRDYVKKKLNRACTTNGGSEGWAQLELDDAFHDAFDIPDEVHVREIHVYTGSRQAADFVLPPTKQYNGMIMELKCENKNSNSGKAMKDLVSGDIEKEKELNSQYKAYTFRVLAMAWSDQAETAIESLGLKAMPDVKAEVKAGVMKMFQKTISTGSGSDDVDELTQGMENLNTDDKNEDKKTDTAGTGEANTGEAATGKTKTDDANTKGGKKASGKKDSGKKDSGEKGGSKASDKKDSGKNSGKKGGKKDSGKKGGSGAGTSATS